MHMPAATGLARLLRSVYSGQLLRADVLAGLTTGAVVVPKCMAYASVAGLPAEAGLYAAFLPMLVYALLGTARVLSVSTTSTIAILTAAAMSQVAAGADPAPPLTVVITLSLLVGVMLFVAGILRLGFLANFISDPVLTGFKAGIGVLIIADQLPKLLGVHITKAGFFRDIAAVVRHAPEASLLTLALALGTLVLLLFMERRAPRAPAPLLAVIFGIATMAAVGVGASGVETVGELRAGLPGVGFPDPELVLTLWPIALGIALMSFTETIATGRAFAAPGEPRPRADRELIALGIGNILGGLTNAMPAGGGASQTVVNMRAGARTRVAGVVTAGVTVATLLALAPLIALLPLATLAAIVVATTLGLIDPREFRAILTVRRTEFYWAVTAFAGVVLLGSLPGILVAVLISVLTLIYHANRPAVYEVARMPGSSVFRPVAIDHPLDQTAPGVLILRTEGRIHFANAQSIGDKMWSLIQAASPRAVILDCSAVPDIEYTALRMLTEAEDKLRKSDITLSLAALNPQALQVVTSSPLGRRLGPQRVFFTLDEALARCTACADS